ncbi:transposable element Tcb1 transposase [Trichonephila clavipes]|nr:transposable element Tcb1 transposase [Trichonephila clavipes]
MMVRVYEDEAMPLKMTAASVECHTMDWCSQASASRKKVRAEKSRIKIMSINFFDSQDIILKKFQHEGTTMNAVRYIEILSHFMKRLRGERFEDIPNIQRNMTKLLNSIPKEDFVQSFQSMHSRSQRYIVMGGDYFEKDIMSRRKQRTAFHQVSEFDRGRIGAYRDCGLPFREIGTRVGRNQTTVMRMCDLWMQEDTTDRRG